MSKNSRTPKLCTKGLARLVRRKREYFLVKELLKKVKLHHCKGSFASSDAGQDPNSNSIHNPVPLVLSSCFRKYYKVSSSRSVTATIC